MIGQRFNSRNHLAPFSIKTRHSPSTSRSINTSTTTEFNMPMGRMVMRSRRASCDQGSTPLVKLPSGPRRQSAPTRLDEDWEGELENLDLGEKLREINRRTGSFLEVPSETESKSSQDKPLSQCSFNPFYTILKVLLLMVFIPPFLNYASLQNESRSLSPPGVLERSRAGHRLFMNCSGRGQPVVMMDTPGGSSSDVWSLIQPQVAKFTKACVYDRTGLGFSESHAQNRPWNETSNDDDVRKRLQPSVENMADDLHSMLKAASNGSNFVLVGGGLGAVNARFYAQMFENVYGLVLVNSFHEDMFTSGTNEWTTFWYEKLIPSLQLYQILASLGITRLGLITGIVKPEILGDARVADDVKTRQKYLLCNSAHLTSGILEHYYINESLTQLKILRKLKPFPGRVTVNIISSEKFSRHVTSSLNAFWKRNQQLLIEDVFPHGERTLVRGDFNSVYFHDATVIVKTIRKVVNKFRKSVKQAASI